MAIAYTINELKAILKKAKKECSEEDYFCPKCEMITDSYTCPCDYY